MLLSIKLKVFLPVRDTMGGLLVGRMTGRNAIESVQVVAHVAIDGVTPIHGVENVTAANVTEELYNFLYGNQLNNKLTIAKI